MKALKVHMTRGLSHNSSMETCDNSGAKIVKIVSVKHYNTSKGKKPQAGIGDLVMVVVIKGKPDMRKTVHPAVIVRQRRPYQRPDGTWVKFEDNAVVIIKDEFGTPKGTIFKGPIAREVADRWPIVAKTASMIV